MFGAEETTSAVVVGRFIELSGDADEIEAVQAAIAERSGVLFVAGNSTFNGSMHELVRGVVGVTVVQLTDAGEVSVTKEAVAQAARHEVDLDGISGVGEVGVWLVRFGPIPYPAVTLRSGTEVLASLTPIELAHPNDPPPYPDTRAAEMVSVPNDRDLTLTVEPF